MSSRKEKWIFSDGDDTRVTIKIGNETFKLKNVIIGGRSDTDDSPVGVYSGVLDVAEMGLSLLALFRAIVRTTRDEMGMPAHAAEDFIIFCLAEAIKREHEEFKQHDIAEFVNDFFNKKF